MVLVMQSLGFVFCISLLLAIAGSIRVPTNSQSALRQPETKRHVPLFVFGDSLYDPGNNNFLNVSIFEQGTYSPYGETFFRYPTGRRSNGRLVSDFIAMRANLPLWKPYFASGIEDFIHGANFASAGASILTIDTNEGPLKLAQQLSYFKNVTSLLGEQFGDAETKNKLLMKAVYMFNIGSADYFLFATSYANATEAVIEEYVNWVIGNTTDAVKEIYKLGGRKFAFQNVPPIGCWPKTKLEFNLSKDECLEELLELPRLHSKAFSNAIKELEKQLSEFKYLIFDFYNALYDRIKSPLKYGFKEADIACCGSGNYRGEDCGIGEYDLCDDPNEYVFFDSVHPSEYTHSQLAELLWSGGSNVTAPLNMKQLFELELESENFSTLAAFAYE